MSDSKDPPKPMGIKAAMYGYEDYDKSFSNKFFGKDNVIQSVKNLVMRGITRNNLEWGTYQKFASAAPNPDDWDQGHQGSGHGKKLFENWEAAVEEAREDLAKMPVDLDEAGPDPMNPWVHADNMLDHLTKSVRIALFDMKMPDQTDSGIPVKVKVKFHDKHWRRHKVETKWGFNPDDPQLKITMTCPNGGWIGTALWRDYNGTFGPFTNYTATYVVPAEPTTKEEQILFIFNGLESKPGGDIRPGILQPVLQWTQQDKWAIRSWYVPASYDPSFTDMPALADKKDFTGPDNLAFTAATPVAVGDTLQGIIVWDGANVRYVSSFTWQHGADAAVQAAVLAAPGIAPLTYPVAVIEAYMKDPKVTIQSDHLVDISMTQVTLKCWNSAQPVKPKWDTGKDDDVGDGIHHATNKLKKYKVKADYDSGTKMSSVKFTRK